MLTSDLVRVTQKEGVIRPRYVAAHSRLQRERSEALVHAFESNVGNPRRVLDDAIAGLIGQRTDFQVQRGLVKLLMDRSEWEVDSPVEPADVRKRLFERAAEKAPVTRFGDGILGTPRHEVIQEVAEELAMTPEKLEGCLYSDLKQNQILTSFDPMAPDALLHRYNTALAQGVLLRAHTLRIDVEGESPKRLQALMRAIKFHGLIHHVEQQERGWHRITLDGPLSLFRLSTKYGVKMANFLPALLLADCWRLEAEVGWEPRQPPSLFRLTAEEGLQSHYRDRGTWVSDEEKALRSKLEKGKDGWRIVDEPRMITLQNGEVLVPDLVMRHDDGREAMVDIVWFWKKGSLERKLASLKHGAPPNLIFAVSERLKTDEEEMEDLPISVLRFKGILPSPKIVEKAEEVGI